MSLLPEQQSWETQQGLLELPMGDKVESAMLIGTGPTSIASISCCSITINARKMGIRHRSILSLSAA